MDTNKSIDALNTFIDINNNRFESYEKIAQQNNESDLTKLFDEFKEKSQKCKEELISEVQQLGGTPIKISNKILPIQLFWIKLNSKFKINDREDILNRCEYADSLNLKKFKNILSNNFENLSQKQQKMLKAQYQSIKTDHSILKNLGDICWFLAK